MNQVFSNILFNSFKYINIIINGSIFHVMKILKGKRTFHRTKSCVEERATVMAKITLLKRIMRSHASFTQFLPMVIFYIILVIRNLISEPCVCM